MGKKANKATRKFAASGQLKKTIDSRRKHQQIKRKTDARLKRKGGANGVRKGKEKEKDAGSDDSELQELSEDGAVETKAGKSTGAAGKKLSVDDFLGAAFMEDEDVVRDK
jgi:nucleolar complex protein 2